MGTQIYMSGGGAAASTVQTLATTGSVTAWNSIVTATGAGASTVTLPDALAPTIGTSVTVRNTGTGAVTVTPFAGNTVTGQTLISAGTSVTYTVTALGTVVTSQDVSLPSVSTPITSVVGWFDTGDIGGGTLGAMPVGGQVISAIKASNNGGNTFTVTIPNMGNTTYPLWIYTEGLGAFPWDSATTSLIVGHAKTATAFNLYMKADDEVAFSGPQNIRVWVYAMSDLPSATTVSAGSITPTPLASCSISALGGGIGSGSPVMSLTSVTTSASFPQTLAPTTARLNLTAAGWTNVSFSKVLNTGLVVGATGITVATAGRYRVQASATIQGINGSSIQIVRNGVILAIGGLYAQTPSGRGVPEAFCIADLVAGDVLDFRVSNQNANGLGVELFAVDVVQLPNSTIVDPGTVPVVDLHWARYWLATVAAPSTSFATAPGTSLINLLTSSETFGLTTSGSDIAVAQSGRYRFDWLLLAPNTELNDDGAVHVVVNGVSVRDVFYDMNQTSAVNQTTGTLTVALVAGDLVSVRYAGTPTADTIVWGRGSYVQVQQVATSSIGVSSTTPVITDVTLATGTNTNVASAAAVKAYVDENTKAPNVILFAAAGTYTPSAGMKWVEVEMVGGGGGGGGAVATTAALPVSVGGSAGAGGYIRAILTAAQIGASQAVTVGAAGTAGAAGGTGGTGGTSSLGALLSCTGGVGGVASAASAGVALALGGAGGAFTVTVGSLVAARQGDSAAVSMAVVSGTAIGMTTANGASSPFGRGGRGVALNATTATLSTGLNGNASAGPGAGASGSVNAGTAAAARAGVAGSLGRVVITEFF